MVCRLQAHPVNAMALQLQELPIIMALPVINNNNNNKEQESSSDQQQYVSCFYLSLNEDVFSAPTLSTSSMRRAYI